MTTSPAPQPADGEREQDPWATEPADWTREQAEAAQAELDELERTDPDVRAAAESYDRMVKRVTRRKPTTPASAEPTAEQQAAAQDLLDCARADDPFPYCDNHGGPWPCADATRVARALAAAVTAEREKYLRVADELYDQSTEMKDTVIELLEDGKNRRANLIEGERIGLEDAARRIREVTT